MALTKVPSNLDATIATTQSQADNSTNIATTAYVDLAVSNLSDSAPAALNTLNEIAAALGDDANYASTTTAAIAAKLPLAGGTMTGNLTVNAIVDADNFKINNAQGSDGQVLTSTGSGVAWEAIPAGGVAGIVTSADATAITIDSLENVGIGVVPEAWYSYYDVLQIGSGASLAGSTTNKSRAFLNANVYINSSNAQSYIATDEASQYWQNGGTHIFNVAASGTADSTISWTTAMTIDSTGKVGIGTDTPDSELQIMNNNSSSYRFGYAGTSDVYLDADNVYFRTDNGGVNTATITTAGLGIGTTSPSAPLDIVTDSVVYAAEFTQSKTSNGDGVLINIGSAAAADYALTVRSNAGNTSVLACKGDGKVGIGTFVPDYPLHVKGAGHQRIKVEKTDAGGDADISIACRSDGIGWVLFTDAQAGANSGVIKYVHNGDYMSFRTNGTDNRLVIDSAGNIGIGTASPAKLGITGSSAGKVLELTGDDCQIRLANSILHHDNSGNTTLHLRNHYGATSSYARTKIESGFITFHTGTSFTERLRINSSGRQTYNSSGTANAHATFVGEVGAGYKALAFERTVGGGEVGTIVANSSSTSYNTTSDYRLKENVVTDWDATTRLKQLKPSRFNFITDADNTVDGFLAHEVSSVVPEAITGTKDAVDSEGNPDYQGIDQSKLVPLLVKTIQELEARITTLEG